MTLSKEAQKLGLCLFKNSNGTYCLCKELKDFNVVENPLGLKVVLSLLRSLKRLIMSRVCLTL